MKAIERVRFLAASEHRVEILQSLVDESFSPADLRDGTAVSRATVHRVLDSFKEYGWVRRTDGKYTATAAGRLVLERFEVVRDTAAEVDALSDFLTGFECTRGLPLPLDDYDIVTASQSDPHAAAEYFISSIPTDASQLRALLPTVVPMFNRACEPLVEKGASVELVLSPSAGKTSQESYPDDFEEARSLDSLSLFISPEAFGYGLSVFEDEVFLGAYDDAGRLQSCLHSTDSDLHEWAISAFREVRADATEVGVDRPKPQP
jgi:predicted transcriptional regulator